MLRERSRAPGRGLLDVVEAGLTRWLVRGWPLGAEDLTDRLRLVAREFGQRAWV
jgi:hypothetical protein